MTLGSRIVVEHRDALAHPAAQLGEQLDRQGVATLRELGDAGAGDPVEVAVAEGRERRGTLVAVGHALTRIAYEGAAARVLLPAAVLAAAAQDAVGHDAHVADLGGDAEATAEQLAAVHDATTDAGADRDEQQVVGVLAGTEAELAPRRSVGVVLDDDGQVDEGADALAERLLAPVDVGREAHGRPVLADEAGGTDADAGGLLLADQSLDEVGHDLRDLGRVVGRRLGCRAEDLAIVGHESGRDLGSADVDANGQCHVSSRGVIAVSMSSRSERVSWAADSETLARASGLSRTKPATWQTGHQVVVHT